jgi:hypothetical protein
MFDALKAMLLKIKLVWDVTSCRSVNGYRRFERAGRYFILQLLLSDCLTLKINTIRCLETAVIVNKPIGRNI